MHDDGGGAALDLQRDQHPGQARLARVERAALVGVVKDGAGEKGGAAGEDVAKEVARRARSAGQRGDDQGIVIDLGGVVAGDGVGRNVAGRVGLGDRDLLVGRGVEEELPVAARGPGEAGGQADDGAGQAGLPDVEQAVGQAAGACPIVLPDLAADGDNLGGQHVAKVAVAVDLAGHGGGNEQGVGVDGGHAAAR